MPLILGTNSIKDTGYNVDNSCRFDRASTDNMTKSMSDGSSIKGTFSAWIKVDGTGNEMNILSHFQDTSNVFSIATSGSSVYVVDYNSGYSLQLATNRIMRDPSAWFHLYVAIDRSQGTANNRNRIFINGVEETSFSNRTNYGQQTSGGHQDAISMNDGDCTMYLGGLGDGNQMFGGYLAEVVWLDGTASAVTNFGEFDEDSGIWKPIDVSGLSSSKGTNGFYLDFEDASNLGNDAFGGTDLGENNIVAANQSTDTCTNNFATMNPLDTNSNHTLSEGNLKTVYSAAAGTFGVTKGTVGVSAGKWYWEIKYTYGNAGQFGVFDINDLDTLNTTDIFSAAGNSTFEGLAWRIDTSNNIKEVGVGQSADSGLDFTSGAILGIAFDADNGKFYGFKNGAEITGQDIGAGTSLLTAVTVSDFYLPFVSNGDGGSGTKTGTSEFNFGSPPFAISSSNADGNGYGNFEYAVPSGYYALNTKNLAEYG